MANVNAGAKPQDPGKYEISSRMKTVIAVCTFIGFIGFIVALMNSKDAARPWAAYLVALFYFVSLALGGLFFAAIQHVTKAGWSVNVRRLSEALTGFLPAGFALSLVLLAVGAPKLYEWLHASVVAADDLLQAKSAYLNGPFFAVRLVVFFVLWLVFAKVIVGGSLKQDQSGDVRITQNLAKVGVAFLVVFALSYSLFSVDLIMSVQPHWFSTIFGVYCFAGLFQMTMATTILLILYMKKKGHLQGFVTADHLHDLGKFLFAFTVFWAYIAFSQYMLIWYANLPEETSFIIPRTQGGWLPVSLLLLIGRFIVPFLALLPRWAKRTPVHLGAISVWLLLMEYVDLYWLVYPAYYKEAPQFGFYEVSIFLGFAGIFLFLLTRFLSRNSLVPLKDPRIQESLHHHVTY